MDVLELPKIRCKSCGSTRISSNYNSYVSLIKSGCKPVEAFETLGISRYCCRMEITTPIKLPFGPPPEQRVISGEVSLESEIISVNPVRSELARKAAVVETRFAIGNTAVKPQKREIKTTKLSRIGREEIETKTVYPEERITTQLEISQREPMSREEAEEEAQRLLEDVYGVYEPLKTRGGEHGVNQALIQMARNDAEENRRRNEEEKLENRVYRAI
jgi:DNA-directed RNA polymerase subunit N (RpoN/RPB10)